MRWFWGTQRELFNPRQFWPGSGREGFDLRATAGAAPIVPHDTKQSGQCVARTERLTAQVALSCEVFFGWPKARHSLAGSFLSSRHLKQPPTYGVTHAFCLPTVQVSIQRTISSRCVFRRSSPCWKPAPSWFWVLMLVSQASERNLATSCAIFKARLSEGDLRRFSQALSCCLAQPQGCSRFPHPGMKP